MTALAKSPAQALAELETWTTDDLRAELARLLRTTASDLLRMAKVVAILESRGDDLMSLRLGMIRWLRMIAVGQLLPEIVIRYSGKQKLLERIAMLPISDQQRMVEDPCVTIIADDGLPRRMDALAVPFRQLDQVFGSGRLRGEDEQRVYLNGSKRAKKSRRKTDEFRQLKAYADHERGGITVGKAFVSKAEALIAIGELAGPLVDIDPRDKTHETATVRLTKEEKDRLRAQERQAGLSEWQLIRTALRAAGMI